MGYPAPSQSFGLSVIRGSSQERGLAVSMICKVVSLAESKLLFHFQEHTGHVPEPLRTLARISQCKQHQWLAADFKIAPDELGGDRLLLMRCYGDSWPPGWPRGPSPLGARVLLTCHLQQCGFPTMWMLFSKLPSLRHCMAKSRERRRKRICDGSGWILSVWDHNCDHTILCGLGEFSVHCMDTTTWPLG